MGSISHNEVYIIHLGRQCDKGDTSLADDVIMTGLNMLAFGTNSPLKQFNKGIVTLQQQHQVGPLIGPGSEQEEPDLCVVHEGAFAIWY